MDKKDIKAYIEGLKAKRQEHYNAAQQIEDELRAYGITDFGSRQVFKRKKCNTCGGIGSIWHMLDGSIDCPECKGKGYRAACDYCGGSGQDPNDNYGSTPCYKCRGTGYAK